MRELGDTVIERNDAKEPLTERELRMILKAAGGVEAVRAEPNLIRRPILVKHGRAVVATTRTPYDSC